MESKPSHLPNNRIHWVVVRDRSGFLNYLTEWRSGWETAFNRSLPDTVLKRYFVDPPLGPSVVILGFDRESVVASSTLVPLSLTDPISSSTIKYFQYISAYVLTGYSNGFDTYKDMLDLVRAEMDNTPLRFILSFPNENAKRLMTRIGKFELLDVGFFIRGKLESKIIEKLRTELRKPFFDQNLLRWRMHEGISQDKGAIFKTYQGELNLLDVTSESHREDLEGLMPWWESWGDSPYASVDQYRLNLCVYTKDTIPIIKRSFLLSDVF